MNMVQADVSTSSVSSEKRLGRIKTPVWQVNEDKIFTAAEPT